jgi:thiol-disulfide isomerase/thioredoxin
MIERLLLVALLSAIGVAVYCIFVRHQVSRLANMEHTTDPILSRLQMGIPTIVYFTTPHCIPCKTQQQPALSKIRETLGDEGVQIIQIDATEDTDSADRWGVFSAPTTFVLDRQGKAQSVNYGVADVPKLLKQLNSVG